MALEAVAVVDQYPIHRPLGSVATAVATAAEAEAVAVAPRAGLAAAGPRV